MMEKYTLKERDYLDLWQHFSEDTAKIKDKLWTIASWLYALMSGLLGFIAKCQIEGKSDAFWTYTMAIVGIMLSTYTVFMIREYGWHIRGGWKITDFLRTKKIVGLEEIWDSRKGKPRPKWENWLYGEDDGEGLPPFVHRLLWLAYGYGLGFVGVLIYGILK